MSAIVTQLARVMKVASSVLLAIAAGLLIVVFAGVMWVVIPSLTQDTKITTKDGATTIQQPIGSTLKFGTLEDAASSSTPASTTTPGSTAAPGSTTVPGTTAAPGSTTSSAPADRSAARILASVTVPAHRGRPTWHVRHGDVSRSATSRRTLIRISSSAKGAPGDAPTTPIGDPPASDPPANQGATITQPLESTTNTDALIATVAAFLLLGAGLLVALLRSMQSSDPEPPTPPTVMDDVNAAIDAAATARDAAARVKTGEAATRPYMLQVVINAKEAARRAYAVADWMTKAKCSAADVADVRAKADAAANVAMPQGALVDTEAETAAETAVIAAQRAAEAVIAGPPAMSAPPPAPTTTTADDS
ncbi:hypothetical protein [Baekduia sp.]|jgi:hypothetical protein|uniref:hypothetical protein n=1 Tax=Baekduia sp. TaxID=2600305 RepID=UPI002DF9F334|nr:hypothetical protein [Baekduia sp.]